MNWIKYLIGFLIGGVALATGSTQINLEPSVVDYPLLVNKDIEKLEYIYIGERENQKHHDQAYLDWQAGIITEQEWLDEWSKFGERKTWIAYEKSVVRQKLGYGIGYQEDIPKEIRDAETTEKNLFKKSTKWNVDLDKVINENIALAAEDYTASCLGGAYNEADPNNKIPITSTKVDWAAIASTDDAYVDCDKGANYFPAGGTFDQLFEQYVNSASVQDYIHAGWAIADDEGTIDSLAFSGSANVLLNLGYERVGATMQVYVYEVINGSFTGNDNQASLSLDTIYYFRTKRTTAGANGTWTVDIYNNASDRTNEVNAVGNLSVALGADNNYDYLYAFMNDGRTDANTVTGYSQNLDLQDAPAVAAPIDDTYFNILEDN